jgi:PAS domain S-box-containing protein
VSEVSGIRLLVIEDSIDDMTLMLYQLRKSPLKLIQARRVETAEELNTALSAQPWDVIISDFRLPRFDILAALAIVKERNFLEPFIIVSGRVGEEAATMALKNGAHDFVSKDSLSKLPDVLLREIERANDRKEKLFIEEQLRLVSLVFDNTSEGIVITNRDNRIIKTNTAFTTITGYVEAEVIGENPSILSSKTMSKSFFDQMWDDLNQTGHWGGEIINRRKSGDFYSEWLRINVVKDKNQQITNFIAILSDVSDKKKAEQDLIDTNRKLNEAIERANELARRAESANLAKRDFLANMSHEIRTPMHVIIGLTELLQESELNSRQRDSVRMILESSHLLLNTINDVLDFSKIEANALKIEYVPFALDEIINSLVPMLKPKATEKQLAFNVDIDPLVPRRLIGDSFRIRQVLLNLASNAVKFTFRGEVSIEIRLIGDIVENYASVEFLIRDTGVGISNNAQARLFRPFEQADSSTTRKFGGSGLGLAICKSLVESMGGSIGVTSNEGSGSKFYFFLNLRIDTQQSSIKTDPPKAQRSSLPQLEPNFTGKTVLLVEDCEPSQILGTYLLNNLGFQVEIAGTGKQAVEIICSKHLDLVLMDVQMPEMDGLEATRIIRRDARFNSLPIIAMTAHALNEDRERCLAAGMNDYLAKPLDRQRFIEKLVQWIVNRPTVEARLTLPS